MRLTALTILLTLPMLAAAAVPPAPVMDKDCRIATDAKGNRVATCTSTDAKADAKAPAARDAKARLKSATSKVLDCRSASTPTDKLLCLAVRQDEPQPEIPAPGNEIG